MNEHKRIRPAQSGTDSMCPRKHAWNTPSIPNPPAKTEYDPHTDPRPAESFFRNSYAVLIRGKSVRRHLYFNLPAAQRALERAEKRGDRAELVLVRLVPVDARYLDQEVTSLE